MSDTEKKEILEQEKDLETDELDAVAGGKACACIVGGGGEADAGETTCGCVVGGVGGYKEKNDPRCLCPIVGGGVAAAPSE